MLRKLSQPEVHKETLDFYQSNAAGYFEDTAHGDMSHAYQRFVPLISEGGVVVDAGCGSGRDSRYFLSKGLIPIPFDASSEMARVVYERTGLEVCVATFEDFVVSHEVDGIWACASLLHVNRVALPGTIQRLGGFLKKGGAFYLSFKSGDGDRLVNRRYFCDMDEALSHKLVSEIEGFHILDYWTSVQVSASLKTNWSNLLLQKD